MRRHHPQGNLGHGYIEPQVRRGVTHVDLPISFSTETVLLLQRLGRELRLTDQILSIDLDTVSIVAGGPAPAWTSLEGDHVTFSMAQMPRPITRFDVAVWLGTNAHELGHVLFSPRKGSRLMTRVIEGDRTFMPGLAQMVNVVEDQRQERLLLAMFAPWTPYLTAALGFHLSLDGEAWLLMAGRTWLPSHVRAQARATSMVLHGQTMTDAVEQLIDDYQRLTDPGDDESDEAWRIATELWNLYDLRQPSLPQPCTVIDGGEPNTSEPGEGAPGTAGECRPDGSGGDGDPTETEGEGGKADVDGQGGKGDSTDDGDDSDSSDSGQGAGSSPADPTKAVKDAIRKAVGRQLASDPDAAADLDSVMDALRYGRAGDSVSGNDAAGRHNPATAVAIRLHHEVSDALTDLRDQCEPGWVKRTDSGRLNMRRLLDPNCPADEIFDRYEPGQLDASELEVVVLPDISGSMAGSMFKLAEATWAIRRAVDDLEGRCTVIAWESGPHWVVNQPGDRPDDRMFVLDSRGGTNPTSALREAYQLVAGSTARNRLVVILTDGAWDSRGVEEVAALNASGAITVIGLLGTGAGEDLHGCQFGAHIGEPSELALLFRRVAVEQIGKWR